MTDLGLIEKPITLEFPELKRAKLMDSLIDPKLNDNLLEIDFEQMITFAIYETIHENIIEIPSIYTLIQKIKSYSRSLDRKGRQEVVKILTRGAIRYQILTHQKDEKDEDVKEKVSVFSRIFRRR